MTMDRQIVTAARRASAGLRFLIVEDELMVVWYLVDMLHELGHVICDTVATEKAAIKAASRLRPDIILMDYRLKNGGDGISAARLIRATSNVPIVFCTAYTELPKMDLTDCCFVRKPVRSSTLKTAITTLLASRQS